MLSVDVAFEEETVWLTQEQMAELFQKAKSTINEHIKNIYEEGELIKESTVRKFGNSEFSTKPTNYYNLDMIISVGYRVKSQRGVQFRIWASNILKEYLKKGFDMDDERLKNLGGGGYLDFAERQAEREIAMAMTDWANHLDGILTSTGEQLLVGNGSVSHNQAMKKAEEEYKKYKARTISDVERDYLESICELEEKAKKKYSN